MTPEDIERLHAEALARGVPATKLDALRAAALKEVGSLEEMARWVRIQQSFKEFLLMLRDPYWRP